MRISIIFYLSECAINFQINTHFRGFSRKRSLYSTKHSIIISTTLFRIIVLLIVLEWWNLIKEKKDTQLISGIFKTFLFPTFPAKNPWIIILSRCSFNGILSYVLYKFKLNCWNFHQVSWIIFAGYFKMRFGNQI